MVMKPDRLAISVDDYEQMIKQGILTENHNIELIRGEIRTKMSVGDLHSACVKRLIQLFANLAGNRATLSVQDPIRVIDSVPEPDFVLLTPRGDFYASGKPGPADILLLVEVADSSLRFDRETKLPLYSEAGIAEYWVANVIDRSLEVDRGPRPDGSYTHIQELKIGDSITPVALPDVTIAVASIL